MDNLTIIGVLQSHRFIVDQNVGKLARFMRLLGFDTTSFCGTNDSQLVNIAIYEKRIILTRDTHILSRSLVQKGLVKAASIKTDIPIRQVEQVVSELELGCQIQPFVLCLECNFPLVPIEKTEIESRVPLYIYQTQNEFSECRRCHRIYWKGTHWQSLASRVNQITGN